MREIVLDTETTGLSPNEGHRIIEIGCVELINLMPTGVVRQWYLNPDRDVPVEATRVHGITTAFLADKPRFAEVVGDLLEFLGDVPVVAHNAGFDLGFLNAELGKLGLKPIAASRAVDTVEMARRLFPGAHANLDTLCKRFNIDLTKRTKHGALLDAQLLAEVYLELRGGRQAGLVLEPIRVARATAAQVAQHRKARTARPHQPTEEERLAHQQLLTELKTPLWLQ